MKKLFFLFLLFSSIFVFAQKNLNPYKYVIIPSRFEFQNEDNQYGLNMLLKYKFDQLGFTVYMESEGLPKFILDSRCLALYPFIKESGGVFVTKLKLEVRDCYGEVLFLTKEGSSRDKSYKVAYNQALRSSLNSFNGYSLQYSAKNNLTNTNLSSNTSSQNLISNTKLSDAHLVFKPLRTSFVILDSDTQEVIFTIYLSKKSDTYFIKGESGLIYKNNNNWFREYFENEKVVIEQLDIRF
jgi:hypothetical protein